MKNAHVVSHTQSYAITMKVITVIVITAVILVARDMGSLRQNQNTKVAELPPSAPAPPVSLPAKQVTTSAQSSPPVTSSELKAPTPSVSVTPTPAPTPGHTGV